MNRMLLFPRLAVNGIKKNRRTYLPYILTCSGMIMMYYITSFLTVSQFVREMKGGDIMQQLLFMGCGVMIVFSAVFLFYTNSFIIRRRKTEFGLYNILGMDKRNLSRILLWETLMIFVISVVVGISCGILFSKLAELALTKMLGGAASYTFNAEPKSIIHALVYYAVIFLLILINSLRQIHLANPIELMKSENSGEKPPKANYVLAVMGALILGAAYFMAVYIKEPLSATRSERSLYIMKDTYIYPAVFDYAEDGISITFPDLPGCLPCADTVEEAVKNAKEAMQLHLFGMEEDNEEIPEPTPISEIAPEKNQAIILIDAFMPPFRERQRTKFVKKTLSIPSWLNAEAEHCGVNFSAVLQEALKEKLHLA